MLISLIIHKPVLRNINIQSASHKPRRARLFNNFFLRKPYNNFMKALHILVSCLNLLVKGLTSKTKQRLKPEIRFYIKNCVHPIRLVCWMFLLLNISEHV